MSEQIDYCEQAYQVLRAEPNSRVDRDSFESGYRACEDAELTDLREKLAAVREKLELIRTVHCWSYTAINNLAIQALAIIDAEPSA